MLLGCMGLRAQNVLLSQEFRFTAESDIPADFALHKDYLSNKFKNWTFTDYCYAIKNNYLQVGTGSGFQGSVTTPVIPFNGSAKVIIRFKQVQSNAANYDIKKPDGNHLSADVPTDGESYSVSFTVVDWTPTSQITISNESSSYYVTNVDVYDISTPFFYEPFNGMNGPSEFEHPSDNFGASNNSCDNIGLTSVFVNDVRQTKGAILLVKNNNKEAAYTTPDLSNVSAEEVLLTYRYAFGSGNTGYYSIAQNGVATALHTGSLSGKTSKTWYSDKVIVSGLTNTSTLTFSGNNVYFDDILLRPIYSTINEALDNSAYLEAYNQTNQNVTLTRTLKTGIWNTLCLPFDVTSTMIGHGAELRTLSYSTNGEFVFNSVGSVPAGTPFLVKVTSEVENPTFSGVTVKNVEPQPVGDDSNYKFCGTYSPINLNTDGTHVFLGTDGAFHKPTADGNRMKGLRAYFIVPSSGTARVSILDEPSAIHSVEADTTVDTGCYDLTGRRHDEQHLTRGLYVRNGKKFYVK